jgi:integrating conjugative element membrane protein (TIGR03747 family)
LFDWMGVINRGGIVYVGLDALSDYEVAGAVGNSMFSDLTSTAGRIYKHGETYGQSAPAPKRRISIHADEFNELIGDEFIPLLNKAGGAGYQVTVYTQTWSDVEARIGSRAKAQQIGGNLNTLIMLRVKNADTAKILTDQLDEVELVTTMSASQASDSNDPLDFSDFTSRNEDRLSARAAPMIGPADLTRLPKGQAFALIEGGRLYKLRLPLPDAEHDPMMPEDLEAVAEDMRGRYVRVTPGEFAPGSGWTTGERCPRSTGRTGCGAWWWRARAVASRRDEGLAAHNVFLWPLKLVFYAWLTLALMALAAMGMEIILAKQVWGEAGVGPGAADPEPRSGAHPRPAAGRAPDRTGPDLRQGVYGFFFQLIPIERWMTNAALLPAHPDVTYYGGDIIARKDFVYPLQDELYLAMLRAQIFGVRLAILMGAAPLFLLVWTLGLVDGLTQRHIRRACAGRESSSMYHRAKFFQFAGLATGAMVYLMWPASIRPEWIVLPLALLTGLLSRVQWTYLKKYL